MVNWHLPDRYLFVQVICAGRKRTNLVMFQCISLWWADSLGWCAMTFGWMSTFWMPYHFPLAKQTLAVRRNDRWIPKASIKIFYCPQSRNMKISVLLIPSCSCYTWCVLFSSQLGCSVSRSSIITFILLGQLFFSSKLTWGDLPAEKLVSTYCR